MEAAPVALVFIGFMGAGKTSAARAAASLLDARAVDADHEIERRLGSSIDAYFAGHGEATFRAVEEEVVAGIEDERLREAVDTLPEAERDVITLRFGLDREQPQALRETGRRLGLSSERVRQLEDRALRRLAQDDAVSALRDAA